MEFYQKINMRGNDIENCPSINNNKKAIGDIDDLKGIGIETLSKAILMLDGRFMKSIDFDATTQKMNIHYKNGSIYTASLAEFIAAFLQGLQFGSIVVADSKPTYSEGTITYYKNGVKSTTTDIKTQFFYQIDTTWNDLMFSSTGDEINISTNLDLTGYLKDTDLLTAYVEGQKDDNTKPVSVTALNNLYILISSKFADIKKVVNLTSSIVLENVIKSKYTTSLYKTGYGVANFFMNMTFACDGTNYTVKLGTLPEECRPLTDICMNCVTNNGEPCYAYINASGAFGLTLCDTQKRLNSDGIRVTVPFVIG